MGKKRTGIVSGSEYKRTVNIGFSERFKDALDHAGLGRCTQADIALRFGLSTPMVNLYTKGKRIPSMETALRICEVTGVSLDWLMLGKGTPDGNFNLEELWMSYSEEDRVNFLARLALKRQK